MRLGLVEYKGGRTAAFSVKPRGIEKERLWAKGQQSESVKQRRWLPKEEAEAYDLLPDFAIIRWGSDDSTSVETVRGRPKWSVPRASHVSEFLVAQDADYQDEEPETVPEAISDIEPEFLMTKTGVVHEKTCSYAKRAHDPIGFQTLEEAAVHPDFQKYCKCILGDE